MGESQTWSYLIQATMLVGNEIKSWTLFGFECVCVFLWNLLRIKEWSQALNVSFISLWCYYIWHAAYFFGFSLSHTHTFSLTHSFALITLAVIFLHPSSLHRYHYGNYVYWKSSLGSPEAKKRFIANTHPTVKQALSGYYEHTNTRFHTVSWDAFKWSTDYLR